MEALRSAKLSLQRIQFRALEQGVSLISASIDASLLTCKKLLLLVPFHPVVESTSGVNVASSISRTRSSYSLLLLMLAIYG